jgi:hypothetical protein
MSWLGGDQEIFFDAMMVFDLGGNIAKRLGSHGENALADVDRKTPQMRLAKIWFYLRHGLRGGARHPLRVLFMLQTLAGRETRR